MIAVIIGLIILCVVLYWIGGQSWAHTLFRDAGCTTCILAISYLVLGWHWSLLGTLLAWGGLAVGDHENYWAVHAFFISFAMALYAIMARQYFVFCLMVFVVTYGTYLVSRFFNRRGVDVFARGLLYATMPLWFLIRW